MYKMIKRLFAAFILIVLLLAGAGWWLLSYIAPERELSLDYEPIDVDSKLVDMMIKLRPELVLTESDVNSLVKMMLVKSGGSVEAEGEAKHVEITGASFELHGEQLHALMNVRYRERIDAELLAVYTLRWDNPNLVLEPQRLTTKKLELPVSMLERKEIPLGISTNLLVRISDVKFQDDHITLRFKLDF